MTVRAYIENDIKKENLKLTWLDVKKAWQKENPNSKIGSAKQNLALYNAWKNKKWRPNQGNTPTVTSTSGAVVSPENTNLGQKEILEKSGVIECLKKLKKYTVDPTIKQNRKGSWYFELKNANFPKHVYQFYSNGKMVKRKVSTDAIEAIVDMDEANWDCPQWKKYRIENGLIGDTPPPTPSATVPQATPTISATPSVTPPVPTPILPLTNDEIRDLSKRERQALKQQIIPERLCVKQIKRFHTAYKKGLNLDLEPGEKDHETTRDIVRRCRTQHKYNDKIQGYLDDLISINYNWEPSKRRFRIMDSKKELKNLVKESLIKKSHQITESKTNKVIKETVLRARLEVFESSLNNFSNLNRIQKIKSGFRFLKEVHSLKNLNFVNEELTNVLKDLFGSSLDNMISNVAKPLFKSILTKLELPEDIKQETLQRILNDEESIVSHMENCESMSQLISDKLSEVVNDKLINQKILGNRFLDDSILKLIEDDGFAEILDEKITDEVCKIFNEFVENAKNLVTKISQDLELPK